MDQDLDLDRFKAIAHEMEFERKRESCDELAPNQTELDFTIACERIRAQTERERIRAEVEKERLHNDLKKTALEMMKGDASTFPALCKLLMK